MGDDEIVTVRDIYNAVQRMNERLTSLVGKVDTIAARAQEDRQHAENLEKQIDKVAEDLGNEIGSVKIKLYAFFIAVTLAGAILMLLEKAVYPGSA